MTLSGYLFWSHWWPSGQSKCLSEMKCTVMSSNHDRVELGVLSTSVPSSTWLKNIYCLFFSDNALKCHTRIEIDITKFVLRSNQLVWLRGHFFKRCSFSCKINVRTGFLDPEDMAKDSKNWLSIGLFKMFSSWIWGIIKYRVKGGTNSCKLFVILKLKTYLIFISGFVVHSVCHYWLIDV